MDRCPYNRSSNGKKSGQIVALGDAILVLLTERPMSGYELAKTFDTSIGFFWRADHPQIYRELARLRDRGHIQGREVVQSGKPNKSVYTLTREGRIALRQWAAGPTNSPSIKDDLLVRFYALDCIDIDALRANLMVRLEHHRGRLSRFERILEKRFPKGATSTAEVGKLLGLRMGLRYERAVVEWCEEALDTLSAETGGATVTSITGSQRDIKG